MAQAIPGNLLDTVHLANVSPDTFAAPAGHSKAWFSEYNVAAWLGFRYQPAQAVGILLEYQDDSGSHTLVVDECAAPDGLQLMLSGRAQINAVGKIRSMKVCCSGVNAGCKLRVDELFVQRLEETAALLRRARLAANA